MRPDASELIRAILWTFENRIVPALPATDELAQSYARTLRFMLAQLGARVQHEGPALEEEHHDLRAVVAELRAHVAPAIAAEFALALQSSEPDRCSSGAARREAVNALRALLVREMPTLSEPARQLVRGYSARQIERDARSLDAPSASPPF